MASGLHIQAACEEGQEARVAAEHGDFPYFGDLGERLGKILM
jgi:hypothetical protein